MKHETAKKLLEKVKSDYNKIAHSFSHTRQHDWEEFEQYLPHVKDKDFLVDLGCGNGRFLDFISKHRQIEYLGIDNSDNLLQEAKKKESESSKFMHGDMLNIPIASERADIAVAIASFHHIPSKRLRLEALMEINRILKNNGIFIVSVWNLYQKKYKKYIWKSRLKWLLSFGKYDPRDTFIPWENTEVKRYYYAFHMKELKKLLEESNFEVIKKFHKKNLIFICKKSASWV